MHCTYIVHTLYIHCTYIVHTLYIHCTCIVHALYIHCTCIVHTLYVHCTFIVHTLSLNFHDNFVLKLFLAMEMLPPCILRIYILLYMKFSTQYVLWSNLFYKNCISFWYILMNIRLNISLLFHHD